MKICVIIPCYNHNAALVRVLEKIPEKFCVIVVDDGSSPALSISRKNSYLLRIPSNKGKANALQTGFQKAIPLGFTHAITMDADNQHPVEKLSEIEATAKANPDAIIVGVRDFENSAIPKGRKFMNKFSNFWFKVETGIALGDTQCGYRCYPLTQLENLNLVLGGFVYEVELLVKAAWAGIAIKEVPIEAIYDAASLSGSHYRPFVDTMRFSKMNSIFFAQSCFLSKKMLRKIALKKSKK